MSDDRQIIIPVTEHNRLVLERRVRRHRLRKAFLKARDRRKNFEQGELAGGLYILGITLLLLGAWGYWGGIRLTWWQRLGFAVAGTMVLVGKTYIKRRFWKRTEDAEYREELEDDE